MPLVPDVLDRSLIDEVVTVTNDEAFETARMLARKEGLLCGISFGAVVAAALKIAKGPEAENKNIVVIFISALKGRDIIFTESD
ncbi:MAG: pyridoxal-phosphate dependent enzyme [Desulfobacteraceae bacterium]|nr:pyridoxal-phosphate dependent enzyme [Desulfobacteraceae bacterium]